ncbi:hypothetical protein C943_00630 [Mariniradius saccharolyticus AK6]|uniref:Uncharacterized protein n=1 Tax=Mariniradius saccharolyticus AK6 TaxID=1239962 RepID=M7XY01_9BACT|nr:hypothetical protein C943_00630 [Mariniradius saccharolyticus AK6]
MVIGTVGLKTMVIQKNEGVNLPQAWRRKRIVSSQISDGMVGSRVKVLYGSHGFLLFK